MVFNSLILYFAQLHIKFPCNQHIWMRFRIKSEHSLYLAAVFIKAHRQNRSCICHGLRIPAVKSTDYFPALIQPPARFNCNKWIFEGFAIKPTAQEKTYRPARITESQNINRRCFRFQHVDSVRIRILRLFVVKAISIIVFMHLFTIKIAAFNTDFHSAFGVYNSTNTIQFQR